MGRFNLDAEGDNALAGSKAPAGAVAPQQGVTEPDDDALIAPVTRERMERTGAMAVKVAKVASKKAVSAAQVGSRFAGMHARKVLAYRPTPTATRGLVVAVVVPVVLVVISGLAYVGWQQWSPPTDTLHPTEPTAGASTPVVEAPAQAVPQPEHAPAVDPADAIASAMGAPREATPEPTQPTPPSDVREMGRPLKPDATPTVQRKASGRIEGDREWKEASTEKVEIYFQQLNNQGEEKER